MTATEHNGSGPWDAIVIGGGHNGLVCAAYLGKAGLSVLVLESREVLGGPCGSFEFIPGYTASFSNSPGSLESRVVSELELADTGLRFERSDPTVLQLFPERPFVVWRDQSRVDAQFDALRAGEGKRYRSFIGSLEDLATRLGVSIFEPCPGLASMASNLKTATDRDLFDRVFHGSLREILYEYLETDEARALIGLLASNVNIVPPSAPGTACGLMFRPIALASATRLPADDFRRMPLRGSTGHPIGGMGAIIDAIANRCRSFGVALRTGARVGRVLYRDGQACGVECEDGTVHEAGVVISAINPKTLFADLLDDAAVGAEIRDGVARVPMRGSAFKMALALDGTPHYANLPGDLTQAQAATCQFRVTHSIDYIEQAITDALSGRPSEHPIIWGLIPSVISPQLAPEGKHIMSLNIWHAPYDLAEGDWADEKDRFAKRCIDALTQFMPDLPDRILDVCSLSPRDCEAELGIVGSNITHGEMLPHTLFGPRPHALANDYRTPLNGLYLTGGGVWPGGFVTGVPGHNTSKAVLADLAHRSKVVPAEAAWHSS
ncbi:MAG: NAD(P)/FAD-dependent oxidoreductase [Chloroflexi bacterium]|nr:NAD(P)/FAD-dependent oxidoreductase [Chloroflexota bacterium]